MIGAGPQKRLIIFETHPIQYRAPVYQELQRVLPGSFEVIYASDCSVVGHLDSGFGQQVAWNTPLLEGYPFQVVHNEKGVPLSSWSSLTGKGIYHLLRQKRPKAILVHSFNYQFDLAVYFSAVMLGIPIWIRIETQDEAFERGPIKTFVRTIIYKILYSKIKKAFYIGELNREHLARHGLKAHQMTKAHYCTPDPLSELSSSEKIARREKIRQRFGLPGNTLVIAFFGKLIFKKDPELLLRAAESVTGPAQKPIAIVYVGSGELEESLKMRSEQLQHNHRLTVVFTGFVNQAELFNFYLGADIVVLPSRRMGETWGLVVNEALQAGCGVVVSDAVGSYRNVGSWERVRVIPVGDAAALAEAVDDLGKMPRDFDWARDSMREYSIEAAAIAIAQATEALV